MVRKKGGDPSFLGQKKKEGKRTPWDPLRGSREKGELIEEKGKSLSKGARPPEGKKDSIFLPQTKGSKTGMEPKKKSPRAYYKKTRRRP